MTFSYDVTNLTVDLYKVRLEIGDTDEDRALLQDEEIEYALSQHSNFNRAVAKCCRLVCMKLAAEPDKFVVEEFGETWQEAFGRYEKLAVRFEALSGISRPWAGGIDVAEKRAAERDTSRVKPKVRKGMYDT